MFRVSFKITFRTHRFRLVSNLTGMVGLMENGVRSPLFLVLTGFIAVGIFAIAWPSLNQAGFPLDDSWIHQVVGRNAAHTGIPGFIPGSPSSGSSSIIWPWVIAINYVLFPSLFPWVYLLTINIICLLVLLAAMFACSLSDELDDLEIFLVVGMPAITGNFIWLLSTGMEHMFFAAAMFLSAYFWTERHSEKSSRHSVLSGAFLGISILTRPEAIVLVPIYLLFARPLNKSLRDLVVFIIPCLGAVAIMTMTNFWLSHSLLPLTLSGKKWLSFGEPPAHGPIILALAYVIAWVARLANNFFEIGFPGGDVQTELIINAIIVMGIGVGRLVRRRAWRILFLLLLAAVIFWVYAVIFPALGHGGRYVSTLMVFIYPLFGLGVLEIADYASVKLRLRSESSTFLKGAAICSVVILALCSLVDWSRITSAGIFHVNNTHVRMGKWIASQLPPSIALASFDIGAITYFGGLNVVDLGGLTDPDYIPFLHAKKVDQYLKNHSVKFVVLPMCEDLQGQTMDCGLEKRLGLNNDFGLKKREIVAFSSPLEIWNLAWNATGHAYRRQVLYEMLEQ